MAASIDELYRKTQRPGAFTPEISHRAPTPMIGDAATFNMTDRRTGFANGFGQFGLRHAALLADRSCTAPYQIFVAPLPIRLPLIQIKI